ncbi:formate/nitrite transporter family protein [Aliifodinibius sp. S!AR15-10]|uniref:formate/nitrite transporter family protein n=1 Tax=Aliifodinibius sp. S!AR15-10 TaxID=2950437 RepID=UPI00285D56E2|nr:formate/nitrite transporter family protein [Aliifodinibius sp. S!AR15-10]MDR8390018.1 formate/nitrite transporter family protein [Aliifodinibius sp. S!AR15-10]
MADNEKESAPEIRKQDQAASGAPHSGWAIGDRFSWQEIQDRLLASASEEITSETQELILSGITAGIAITLTLIGYAVGTSHFPDNAFMAAILYPLGFIYIILGRFQLYTENTLPPVTLILTRLASIPLLLRVWGLVIIGNLIGAIAGGYVLAKTSVLSPDGMEAATTFVSHGLELEWWDVFFRAMFAGWLVAGVVWLNIAARDTISRIIIVYLVFFMICASNLFHVVTAAAEVSFSIFHTTEYEISSLIINYWIPVLLGNTAGGVLLFANMAYFQSERKRYPEFRILSIRDWLFTKKGGRQFGTPRPRPPRDSD